MGMGGANHAVPAINEQASEGRERRRGVGEEEQRGGTGQALLQCFARCFPSWLLTKTAFLDRVMKRTAATTIDTDAPATTTEMGILIWPDAILWQQMELIAVCLR